jgi:uncharacterized membrane protein YeaQ/YmgE (transglycosylase-associated protein family)
MRDARQRPGAKDRVRFDGAVCRALLHVEHPWHDGGKAARTPLAAHNWEMHMMSFLGTVLVGLVVGLIARAIKPGDDKMGWILTILLGIAGSLVAGYVGRAAGWYQPGEPVGWIASVIGAIILLLIYGMVRRKA